MDNSNKNREDNSAMITQSQYHYTIPVFFRDDVISLNELVLSMKRIQKIPDDTRLQKIAEVLDEDKDGQVQISHVLRVRAIYKYVLCGIH